MLKQSPNRNQRTNGYKVKQGLKIFTLIVLAIWLLYQLKHSQETKILGRKGFHLWMNKPYELIGDAKKKKPEIVIEENNGEGDDNVGYNRDRVEDEEPEEVEDTIDDENKEEEEENEAMEEDMSLFEYQGHTEGEKDTQSTTKRHRKETDMNHRYIHQTLN
ncbi:leiomodin-3-like [Trifolium pratense]|uniref:leiomodin-3-like n=1 Tax=Trifolium pratense TaxID=57577 RepID=UPI001E695C6A|nr:leiomodin-3-like [Trifolium pratense]